MVTEADPTAPSRAPLNRERVLRAAVDFADEHGIESLSMRNLAEQLDVQAMSLYNHVANKEDILNGVVDTIVLEIEGVLAAGSAGDDGESWKATIRHRALSARRVLLAHPWAPGLIASRKTMTVTMLRYMDAVLGTLLDGGFSFALAHHAMHTMGSRVLGFTQELFDTGDLGPEVAAIFLQQTPTAEYRNITQMLEFVDHDAATTLGGGCDDQVEFEFGLDLMLDGLERLVAQA
jgi:AcrR family transcriptional regulator